MTPAEQGAPLQWQYFTFRGSPLTLNWIFLQWQDPVLGQSQVCAHFDQKREASALACVGCLKLLTGVSLLVGRLLTPVVRHVCKQLRIRVDQASQDLALAASKLARQPRACPSSLPAASSQMTSNFAAHRDTPMANRCQCST